MSSSPRVMVLSIALCLAGSWPVGASEPLLAPSQPTAPASSQQNKLAAENQLLANGVAQRLRVSGLEHFYVDITTQAGVVYLTGNVVDSRQHDQIIRLVQGVPGVVTVVPQLLIRTQPVQTVQAILQPKDLLPGPPPTKETPKVPPPPGGNAPQDPTPIFRGVHPGEQPHAGAPGPNPNAYNPPRMPPYAWPTYAPYNNYSRVAYPKLYPYNAWPYIGPMYPYPKVPLGWRSVTLSWEDGYWWYGRNATGHDWWRVRYW